MGTRPQSRLLQTKPCAGATVPVERTWWAEGALEYVPVVTEHTVCYLYSRRGHNRTPTMAMIRYYSIDTELRKGKRARTDTPPPKKKQIARDKSCASDI